ncbi:MAG TPA: hypothetical protein VGI45_21545 [Terracidiphilus sp.]|jgi:hypothetical protein
MTVATFPDKETRTARITEMPGTASVDWVKIAACGSLITGGLLLLSGQKRAALVMAASGTALAMLDQEETVRSWWNALPGYVDRAQYMVEQVREVVDDITEKGEAMRRALTREPRPNIPA